MTFLYFYHLFKFQMNLKVFIKIQGCYGRTDGRTEGSVTTCIPLRNFVGDGIKTTPPPPHKIKTSTNYQLLKATPYNNYSSINYGNRRCKWFFFFFKFTIKTMMPVIWQLKALTKNYKYHTSTQHLYLYNKCHSIKNYERLYKFQ